MPNKPKQSGYIPQSIKDKLYKEQNGQCAFVAKDGTNDPSNLRLLCATHNLLMTEVFYGKGKMDVGRNMNGA